MNLYVSPTSVRTLSKYWGCSFLQAMRNLRKSTGATIRFSKYVGHMHGVPAFVHPDGGTTLKITLPKREEATQ